MDLDAFGFERFQQRVQLRPDTHGFTGGLDRIVDVFQSVSGHNGHHGGVLFDQPGFHGFFDARRAGRIFRSEEIL